MSDKLSAAYEELTKEAERVAKEETWCRTGIMPDQLNAMLAVLWLKIKELKDNKP